MIEMLEQNGNYVVDNPEEATICQVYTEARVSKTLTTILQNSFQGTQKSIKAGLGDFHSQTNETSPELEESHA